MEAGSFKETLSGRLGRQMVDGIVRQVEETPARFSELYSLLDDEDSKISWRAAWACEKLCLKYPEFFLPKREELMERAVRCMHDGQKRLLLNMVYLLPVYEPISVMFLDFCLSAMLSPNESVAVQAVCMKLAYSLCLKEPELMGELQAYLENAEPEYLSTAVQCTRRTILKKIRKGRNNSLSEL